MMKLYTTVKSERGKVASKSGNDYLDIDISLNEGKSKLPTVHIVQKRDIVEIYYYYKGKYYTLFDEVLDYELDII